MGRVPEARRPPCGLRQEFVLIVSRLLRFALPSAFRLSRVVSFLWQRAPRAILVLCCWSLLKQMRFGLTAESLLSVCPERSNQERGHPTSAPRVHRAPGVPCGARALQAAAQLAGPARRHSRRAFASARRMRRKRAAAHPCARTCSLCSLSPASRSAARRSTGDPIFLRPGFLPGLRGKVRVRCARPGAEQSVSDLAPASDRG